MREIKLLWCADPIGIFEQKMPGVAIQHPTVLYTAAPADDVEAWLEQNAWARSLPLFSWHPVDGPAWTARNSLRALERTAHATIRTRNFQAPGDGFWSVTGPLPPDLRLRWWESCARPDAVIASAFDLSRALGSPHVWEVCAGHSGGLLAMGAAIVEGRAIALDAGQPGPISWTAATLHNVGLRVIAAGVGQ